MRFKSFAALLTGLAAIAAAGIIILNTFDIRDYLVLKHAESRLKDATEQISLKLTGEVSQNLHIASAISETLAQSPRDDWTGPYLTGALKEIFDEMQFNNVNICGLNGTGFDLEGKEQNVGFCPYYKYALLGDSSVAYAKFYENGKSEDVVYTVPIKQHGSIAGVLRMSWSPDKIRALLSIDTFRGNEDVYLIKRDGAILMALTEDPPEAGNFFELLGTEDEEPRTELEQVVKQGRELLTRGIMSGRNYYLSFKGIKDANDWGVMLSIPDKQLIMLYQDKQVSDIMSNNLKMLLIITAASIALIVISLAAIIQRYRMERLAYFDEVAGSVNYNRFCKDAAVLLRNPANIKYAVIVLEIRNFNYIMDYFGVQECDKIRRYVSKIIHANIDSDETACRYNADKFIILLKYFNKEELINRIGFLDSKLCSFESGDIKNNKYEFRLHYGIYCLEENDANLDRMIEKADIALRRIRNDNRQIYECYSGSMQKSALEQREIEAHMFEALEEKEFLVYLQPKYDLNTGRQAGAEALVRWMHPEKGLLYPGQFIRVFENNGFIVKLDMYILNEICRRLKIWIGKGYHPLPVSVNISRLNLFDENFVQNLIDTLERYGIAANLIQLEMAEGVVTNNLNKLLSLMARLKDYGFSISIDDFGAGTTSMNTLYKVPVDELKLDRKYLLETGKTDRGKNIIHSIIEMAKRLDIKVVAQGVENKAQAKMLHELGCDMVQGFVFSEPLPLKEYENYAYGAGARENII